MKKNEYRSIKELVFEYFYQNRGAGSYKELTKKVLKHFPNSKWKKSHWSFYKTQIKNGRLKQDFADYVVGNAKSSIRGISARDERVKKLADPILNKVRKEIENAADGDELMQFKINRWIFSRLQLYEIKKKKPIKQELWDSGIHKCQSCEKEFKSIKGVEIHRIDSTKGYSVDNCELLCKDCHQKSNGRKLITPNKCGGYI